MRIVTFNTHHGLTSSEDSVDTALLAQYCAGLAADVLALQEIDVNARRSGRADQAAAVAEACGMASVFGAARRMGWRGRYGNALLVRGQIEESRVMALPRKGWRRERRCAVLARVVVGDRRLSVAAAHLSVFRDESPAQLAAVLGAVGAMATPRIVLGDLNLRPDRMESIVEGQAYSLASTLAPTYPAAEPRLRIDHVLSDGLEVLSVEVLDAGPVSDHRALAIEVA